MMASRFMRCRDAVIDAPPRSGVGSRMLTDHLRDTGRRLPPSVSMVTL
jgi:hypothetical protein